MFDKITNYHYNLTFNKQKINLVSLTNLVGSDQPSQGRFAAVLLQTIVRDVNSIYFHINSISYKIIPREDIVEFVFKIDPFMDVKEEDIEQHFQEFIHECRESLNRLFVEIDFVSAQRNQVVIRSFVPEFDTIVHLTDQINTMKELALQKMSGEYSVEVIQKLQQLIFGIQS